MSELWAVENAELDPDFERARLVHKWRGFTVIRLRPSAGTDRITYSRVTLTSDVYMLPLDQPKAIVNLTPEDWSARPRGWMDAQTPVIGSERGGGGLYTVPLDGSEGRPVVDEEIPRVIEFIDGALVWAKYAIEDHHITALIGQRQAKDADEPTEFLRIPIPPDQVMERLDLYGLSCRAERCLFAAPVRDELQFAEVNSSTGERSDPLFTVGIASRSTAWDLSPDGSRIALLLTDPPRLLVHDIDAQTTESRPFPLDIPQNLSWAADGEGLFAVGLLETAAKPYRLLAVDSAGEVSTLWSSMATFCHSALPSPDGQKLLLGFHGFDDDVWLMEGLSGGTME
ncbi:MAG: hypothetical protein HN348_23400 [Proteobacteria bacterium]|nr:hypothetical protein [Pseudomonadota bacterium]